MPDNNTSFFVKDEASVSLNDGSIGNYLGGGVRYNCEGGGTLEGMLAFKSNESSVGGFAEIKATTPYQNNCAFESRTRFQVESGGNSVVTRAALKCSKDFGKFNVYEIAGGSVKFNLKNQENSFIPTSITGIQYNPSKKVGIYTEAGVSKAYNATNNCWGKFTPEVYVGAKFTF